jgi:putative ABC transport system permease protein
VIVIGIAGVVAVLVSVLAMAAGFRHTVADSGRPDRVIILRGGSDAELNSNLTRSDVDTIGNAPGLAKDADGKALLSSEIITVVNVPKIDTGTTRTSPCAASAYRARKCARSSRSWPAACFVRRCAN